MHPLFETQVIHDFHMRLTAAPIIEKAKGYEFKKVE